MQFHNYTALHKLLGILMFSGIILLCILIWEDFNAATYDAWGRALAQSVYDFENNLVTN